MSRPLHGQNHSQGQRAMALVWDSAPEWSRKTEQPEGRRRRMKNNPCSNADISWQRCHCRSVDSWLAERIIHQGLIRGCKTTRCLVEGATRVDEFYWSVQADQVQCFGGVCVCCVSALFRSIGPHICQVVHNVTFHVLLSALFHDFFQTHSFKFRRNMTFLFSIFPALSPWSRVSKHNVLTLPEWRAVSKFSQQHAPEGRMIIPQYIIFRSPVFMANKSAVMQHLHSNHLLCISCI